MQKFNGSLIRQFPSLTTGNAASGVQVSVFISGTNTLATLYVADNVAGAQLGNPLTTSDKGFYSFYAADGKYRLEFNNGYPSLEEQLVDTVDIRDDFQALELSNDAFKSEQQANYDAFVLSQGWDQVGTFAAGFTYTSPNQVGQDADGNWWRWNGVLPKIVAALTDPTSDPDYKLVGDGVLRGDLTNGTALIGDSDALVVGKLADGVFVAASYLVGPATPSGAIAAAIAAAGSNAVFIGKQFEGADVSGIILNANQKVFGYGVNLITTANTFTFALNNNSSVTGVNVTGSGKNSGLTSQDAFFVPSSLGTPISRTKVSDTNIKDMGGSAYRGTYLVNNHEGNVFTNYNIESCNVGINADSRHEYLNAAIGNITLCNTGVRVQGGNTNLTGVVISDNDIGIDLVAGANDAHGQVVGALLNHNITRTVRCDGTANGFLFLGCQIFNGGAIELKNCQDVWFRNCVKQAVAIIEDGATRCGFENNDFIDGINNTPNANANPSEVFYLDNRLPAGTSLTGVDGLNGGLLRLQVNTNITTIPVGANDFQWPVITTNAITANSAYTVQEFYAAGNPFIRGDVMSVRGGASLNLNAQMTFGKAASAAWTADQLRVYLLNSSGDIVGRLIPETQASIGAANTITYSFHGAIARGGIKFVIENNSGGVMTLYRQQAGTATQTYCNVTGW